MGKNKPNISLLSALIGSPKVPLAVDIAPSVYKTTLTLSKDGINYVLKTSSSAGDLDDLNNPLPLPQVNSTFMSRICPDYSSWTFFFFFGYYKGCLSHPN